jgi:uncharacterized protein YegL
VGKVNGDIEGQLWPVYVLADESGSMSPHIDELNAGLHSTCEALLAQPMAAAKARFSVIGFADDAVVRLHLADLREVSGPDPLVSRGITNYGAAFEKLRELIPGDVARLKAQRYAVYRPAVFFLSDGRPSDAEWQAAHRVLTDRTVTREAPNIIACGIGQAQAAIIRQVATRPEYAFIAIAGGDLGSAIMEFFASLTKSITASTRTIATGSTNSLIVEPPRGFALALDEM